MVVALSGSAQVSSQARRKHWLSQAEDAPVVFVSLSKQPFATSRFSEAAAGRAVRHCGVASSPSRFSETHLPYFPFTQISLGIRTKPCASKLSSIVVA